MANKINWKDAEKKIIPDGTEVELVVKKGTYVAQSGQSAQPAVNYQFTVTGPTEWEGTTLFNRFSLQPQSLWAFKQFLVRFGASEEMFEGDDVDIDKILELSVGLSGRALMKVAEYKDKQTGEDKEVNNIKTFLAPQTFDVFSTPATNGKK